MSKHAIPHFGQATRPAEMTSVETSEAASPSEAAAGEEPRVSADAAGAKQADTSEVIRVGVFPEAAQGQEVRGVGWLSKLRGWFGPKAVAAEPVVAPDRVEGRLTLDRVEVVRNSLADEELRVVRVARPARRALAEEMPKPPPALPAPSAEVEEARTHF